MKNKLIIIIIYIKYSDPRNYRRNSLWKASYGVEDTDPTNLRAGPSFEGSNFNADGVFAAQQPERGLRSPRRLFESPLLASESVCIQQPCMVQTCKVAQLKDYSTIKFNLRVSIDAE